MKTIMSKTAACLFAAALTLTGSGISTGAASVTPLTAATIPTASVPGMLGYIPKPRPKTPQSSENGAVQIGGDHTGHGSGSGSNSSEPLTSNDIPTVPAEDIEDEPSIVEPLSSAAPTIKGHESGEETVSTKTLEPGSFILVGDTIAFGDGDCFVYDDQTQTIFNMKRDAVLTINQIIYSEQDCQYSFGYAEGDTYLPIVWFSSELYATPPRGFFVTGGNGTLEHPYTFALTLTLTLPEDNGVTARYTFTDEELDPANINPYGTGEYADRQNNITYTSEKPFILRSEAGVFALPSYDEANAQYILAASYFGSLTVTYIENNVIPVSTPDEFYSVVSMLSEAYANRRDVGFEPVIRLTKDIDLSTVEGERVIYGDLTIDLNGHTLDMSETDPYDVDAMIAGEIMCANGTLTLNDSSSAGTGKVNNVGGFRAFKDADGAAAAVPGGNIVVNGGTYALADGFTFDAEEGCSITLNAGTFSRWETAWNTYLGSADQEAVQTADGYTITPPALGIGTYKQYADKDGKHLIRYVFVKPISEIEGKSKATFTAKYNGRELTFPTNTYYTGLRYNGQQYQLTNGCVLFAVTIAGVPAGDENKLTCDIKLT